MDQLIKEIWMFPHNAETKKGYRTMHALAYLVFYAYELADALDMDVSEVLR